ncbi:CDGSH iron-sulfur domain-containing protein 3, mitochondrial-like [Mercenaria mercenaria]|uniref:CDGSH iron-sulfur domain-containing protein 3, mitochondrial-like n=1 Tax=Mercenaria mercenaria TaxID=6596 RepID=UPI00234E6C10|nr:CDGSH iron-sulfur domain-containing protein 3, mitochondrial-like [Mercenaria mercenaria]
MAAPLTKFSQRCLFSINKQVYNPARLKYWERGEDSIYEKGESPSDRYVGVPQKKKPHPETQVKGQFELNPPKGKIYDKKPFPALLKAGKKYSWCTCGHSKHQPFCDGSHKTVYNVLKRGSAEGKGTFQNILHQPVRFEVEEDGEYWLCNCKQTNGRPFCDGTHKQPEIQAKIKS